MTGEGSSLRAAPGVRRAALAAAVGYAALGLLWIIFSDDVVRAVVDPERMTTLQSTKGVLFVVLSAVFVFAIAVRSAQRFSGAVDLESGERLTAGAWAPVAVFLVLSAAVAGAGYVLHERSVAEKRASTLASLSATAEVKAARAASRIDALKLDASLLAAEAEVRKVLAAGPDGPVTDDARRDLRQEMATYGALHPDRSVLLLDAAGEVVEQAGPGMRAGPELAPAFEASRSARAAVVAEPATDGGLPVVVRVVAAVPGADPAGNALGYVVLGASAREQLPALLARAPGASPSEETLVVRGQGAEVAIVLGAEGDRRLRTADASGDSLPARAARGEDGAYEGVDDRGVESFGAVRRIPGTDWSLVVRRDAAEVYRPLRRRLAGIALFNVALLAGAALATLSWWRGLRVRHLWREKQLAAERDAVARHFTLLSEASNDLVLLTDEEFRIVEVNRKACEVYGYSRTELIGAAASILRPPEQRAAAREAFERLLAEGALHLETTHQRKDGSVFPVDFSGRRIEVDGRPFIQYVIRDITERKRAEDRIRRLNQLYDLLSRANAAIVRTADPAQLTRLVCEIAVEVAGFRLAWMSEANAEGELRAIAVAGPAAAIVGAAPLTLDPDAPSGRGPTADAIRGRAPVVANEYLSNSSTSVWHEAARRFGLESLASFPIPGPEGARGAFAVGAGQKGYFDDEIVKLLSGLAEDVGFALAARDREGERQRAEEALKVTARRLSEAEKIGRTGSFHVDLKTQELSWSDGLRRLLGVASETGPSSGEVLLERVHPEDRERMAGLLRADGATAGEEDLRLAGPEGDVRWIHATAEVVADDAGRPASLFGVVRDVTEEKLAEERERLWSHVLAGSADGVLLAGADQRILLVNRAFETMTGYAAVEVLGRTPRFLGSGHHDRSFYRRMWTTIARTGCWRGEIQNRRSNGEVYPVLLSITAVKDDRGATSHYVAIYTDLTERVAAIERIEFLSQRDPLTHFVNRPGLETQLARAIATSRLEGHALALVTFDVDRFSAINESLGGPVGDEILRSIAGRLAGAVRTRDILARIGPDEFAVGFVSVKGTSGCEIAARKVQAVFASPFEVAGRSVPISASFGVSVCPEDGEDAPALMRSADAALRHAKTGEGGALEFFRREMTARAMETLDLETRLRAAITNGELLLHYQPQVDVETGRVVGAEALVRWKDPERGLIPPGVFIPVAEERGLIVPLGEWVLRAAASQLRQWLDAGLPRVVVAVNVSAAQFRSPDFEGRLVEILAETGVPPELIELEVTESVLARDVEAAAALLGRLRTRGISIAIDDFGTGYSSLGYLRKFPLQRLKIDQGFVREIWNDPSAAAIVRTVIGMSRGLGLKVVAEGVEEKRQFSFLRFHGCDEAQGYFIKRPVPPEVFRAFLEAGDFDPDAPAA
jgi:diguanylate cyclase (GGDEF)-like protein/PAS domain S-box-containing protein